MLSCALQHCRRWLVSRSRAFAGAAAPEFQYTDVFAPAAPKEVAWRKLTDAGVSTMDVQGQRVLKARSAALWWRTLAL
jgi:hypothetical protein